jgi:iron complex outermembrane receptor protein
MISLGVAPRADAQRPFVVLHTAVTEATSGKDLELTANVPRYREVSEVIARYRAQGSAGFRTITMARSQGDFFEAKIPAKDVRPPGLEYFLLIRDREGKTRPGFASAATPQSIAVLAAAGPGGRTALEEELAVLGGEDEVVSAARVRQRIEESPAPITVITAEDIRNYGAHSIAEVLRTVPGMDFMQITAADPNLSSRGFNRELSARLLTLIDGRSAYIDIFGNTFWEVMPISVWEIDRIEVIRGPASTLYGANAFGGVVNIFTKSPDQAKGVHFYTQGGGHGFNSTLMTAGRANKHVSYRLAATFDQASSFDRITTEERIGVRANALVRFELGSGATLDVRGGMIRENLGPIMSLNGPFTTEATMGFAQLNFDWKNFHFQTWYSGFKADVSRTFPLPSSVRLPLGGMVREIPFSQIVGDVRLRDITDARPDTIDMEATYQLGEGQLARTIVGLNYRYNGYNIPSLLEPENKQHLLGFFAQQEIRPHRTVNINLGARIDSLFYSSQVCPREQLTACLDGEAGAPKQDVDALINFAPRGSVVWGFAKDHYLRAGGGIAFRNPSFTEKLIRFEVAPEGTLGPLGSQIAMSTTRPAINFAADTSLKSEQLRSVELGYGANFLAKRVRLNLDLFYLEGLDLIQFQSGSLLSALLGLQELSSQYKNLVDARNYGFEVSLRAQLGPYVKAFANYSWQRVELMKVGGVEARVARAQGNVADLTTIDTESPMHKLNFGINISHTPTGLFLNLYGHYVGSAQRRNLFTALPGAPVSIAPGATFGALTGARAFENIDQYFLLNANFGYRLFSGQLEIGVAGFNVLGDYGAVAFDALTGALSDRRHLEYPRLNMPGAGFGGEAIGARVYGFIRGHFR